MSFDGIARHYRWLETIAFGHALHRARTHWIDKIKRPKRTLIVGEGNGRFLCDLLHIHPRIDIDCVDSSDGMIQLARARLQRTCPESFQHVRFFCEDILKWSPCDSYDLLVTHFFLDCFTCPQLRRVIEKLARAAEPGAAWLIADFTMPRSRLAQIHARCWLKVMYSFFRATTGITAGDLVDPFPFLSANGFVRSASRPSRTGMLKSDLFVSAISPDNGADRIDRSHTVASASRLPMETTLSATLSRE